MASASEVVGFLLRSENRLRVLTLLSVDARTGAELKAECSFSRATRSRVLTGLAEHDLVEKHGREYVATPFGAFLAGELRSLLGEAETMQRVYETSRWLPTEEMDFDIECLREARITPPTAGDPSKPIREAAEALEAATDVRGVTHAVTPYSLAANHRAVTTGEQTLEMVFTAGAIERVLDDHEMATQLRDLVEHERSDVYRYEGACPHVVGTLDDRVVFGVSDDRGTAVGLVETEHEIVYEWATALVDTYRSESKRLEPDELDA